MPVKISNETMKQNKQVDTNMVPAAEWTRLGNSITLVPSHLRSRSQVGHR